MKETPTMPETSYEIEPGRQDLRSTTLIAAPRELVFRAFTEPDLFARWWGPRRYRNEVLKFDSRPGGEWHVVQVAEDGSEHGFRGVNHDVVAPERICQTFEYLGMPRHVAMQTARFETAGSGTRILTQIVFESVQDRDGMVESGMRDGATESMERLAELLAELLAGVGAGN